MPLSKPPMRNHAVRPRLLLTLFALDRVGNSHHGVLGQLLPVHQLLALLYEGQVQPADNCNLASLTYALGVAQEWQGAAQSRSA